MRVVLPLLTAAGTANWVFGSILALLTLTLIVLVAVLLRRRAARTDASAAPVYPAPAVPPAAPVYAAAPAAAPVPVSYPPAAPEERRESLMGSLARGEEPAPKEEPASEPAQPERPMDEKSIDKHFADHHGHWVCPYCETINEPGLVLCQACGQPRN